MKTYVSVILPALKPDNEFLRCIYSIRVSFSDRMPYEIISVVSDLNAFDLLKADDIKFIQEDTSGIYGAMNKGIREAVGRYLYFIGQDDVLLPAVVKAVSAGFETGADLILGNVYWGSRGIFRNSKLRHSLIWRNWCHQGIFYHRQKFIDTVTEYPVQYPVQADHCVNIIFSSGAKLKTFKFDGCVAWYSSDGFSSRFVDNNFREIFPKLILQHFGHIPYFIVVVRRALLQVLKFLRGGN